MCPSFGRLPYKTENVELDKLEAYVKGGGRLKLPDVRLLALMYRADTLQTDNIDLFAGTMDGWNEWFQIVSSCFNKIPHTRPRFDAIESSLVTLYKMQSQIIGEELRDVGLISGLTVEF